MKKMNRILRYLGYFTAVSVFFALVGFVESSKSTAICTGMEIEFEEGDSILLVGPDQIRQVVINQMGEPIGQPLRSMDFNQLEAALKEIPHLRHAAVYSSVDRSVKIEIEQRTSLIRLIDRDGISAIIDREGYLMPLSDQAVLRLPVVTGDFDLDQEKLDNNLHVNDSIAGEFLSKAYEIGYLITSDELWRSQFQHLTMEKNGDVVAFPQVGNHTIIFGNDRFEEKLKMLRVFYRKGMTADTWNQYKSINLKYKDQIVCTKK